MIETALRDGASFCRLTSLIGPKKFYSSTDSKYTEIQQIVFDRKLLTFCIAIRTEYTNAIKYSPGI